MIQIVIENREESAGLLQQFDAQGREYHVTLISRPDGSLEIRLEPPPRLEAKLVFWNGHEYVPVDET